MINENEQENKSHWLACCINFVLVLLQVKSSYCDCLLKLFYEWLVAVGHIFGHYMLFWLTDQHEKYKDFFIQKIPAMANPKVRTWIKWNKE